MILKSSHYDEYNLRYELKSILNVLNRLYQSLEKKVLYHVYMSAYICGTDWSVASNVTSS